MKFIADEGVDAPIVFALRNNGHDVIYILEISPGNPDEEILIEANSQNRVLCRLYIINTPTVFLSA